MELLQILDLCTDKHPVDLRWAPLAPNPVSLPSSGDPATIPPTLTTTVPPPIYLPDKITTTSVTPTETIPKNSGQLSSSSSHRQGYPYGLLICYQFVNLINYGEPLQLTLQLTLPSVLFK